MKKIWNSLKYGNRKTKTMLMAIGLLFLAAIVFTILAVLHQSALWALAAVFSLILAIILMQSVSFKNSGQYAPKKDEKTSSGIDTDANQEESEEDKGNYLSELKQSDIKSILVANKARKDHLPVIIDLCQSERIMQCPAYIWITRSHFHILLFEKNPRSLKIPRNKINKITYNPDVQAKRLIDYQEFQKPSAASLAFGHLLPTYYEETVNGKTIYKKNLYVLEPDIMFTNTSIRYVMQLLRLGVTIEDKVTHSDQYSPYFKEAYKINVLWKDGVYTTQEFKAKIKDTLKVMAEAEVSLKAFNETMKQLVTSRLITKEYADYYIDYRKKYDNKYRNDKRR